MIAFVAEPRNRWTAYESPDDEDWLQIDLDRPREVGRIDLYLYDDGGGVRAPASYRIQSGDGSAWKDVEAPHLDPPRPAGGAVNVATFRPVTTGRVRIVFRHRAGSKSGVTEVELRSR